MVFGNLLGPEDIGSTIVIVRLANEISLPLKGFPFVSLFGSVADNIQVRNVVSQAYGFSQYQQ